MRPKVDLNVNSGLHKQPPATCQFVEFYARVTGATTTDGFPNARWSIVSGFYRATLPCVRPSVASRSFIENG